MAPLACLAIPVIIVSCAVMNNKSQRKAIGKWTTLQTATVLSALHNFLQSVHTLGSYSTDHSIICTLCETRKHQKRRKSSSQCPQTISAINEDTHIQTRTFGSCSHSKPWLRGQLSFPWKPWEGSGSFCALLWDFYSQEVGRLFPKMTFHLP